MVFHRRNFCECFSTGSDIFHCAQIDVSFNDNRAGDQLVAVIDNPGNRETQRENSKEVTSEGVDE